MTPRLGPPVRGMVYTIAVLAASVAWQADYRLAALALVVGALVGVGIDQNQSSRWQQVAGSPSPAT